MSANTCKAITANGEPCHSPAREGSDFCLWHDETLQEEAHRQQVRGGLARRTAHVIGVYPGDISDIHSLVRFLNASLVEAWNLPEGSEKRLRCITQLLRLAIDAIPQLDTDERLRNLEQIIYYGNDNGQADKSPANH